MGTGESGGGEGRGEKKNEGRTRRERYISQQRLPTTFHTLTYSHSRQTITISGIILKEVVGGAPRHMRFSTSRCRVELQEGVFQLI